jgi:hypothetical protein
MLLRKLVLIAVSVLPGGLLLVGVAWLVRELVVRERRQKWEKRFRSWVTQPPNVMLPPSPQP